MLKTIFITTFYWKNISTCFIIRLLSFFSSSIFFIWIFYWTKIDLNNKLIFHLINLRAKNACFWFITQLLPYKTLKSCIAIALQYSSYFNARKKFFFKIYNDIWYAVYRLFLAIASIILNHCISRISDTYIGFDTLFTTTLW